MKAPAAVKKPYRAPALTPLGSLREMTANGSVNKNENNGHPDGRL